MDMNYSVNHVIMEVRVVNESYYKVLPVFKYGIVHYCPLMQ